MVWRMRGKIPNIIKPVLLAAALLLPFSGGVFASIDIAPPACLHFSLSELREVSPLGGELFLRPAPAGEEKIGRILYGENYAWGENIGWVDFSPPEASLEIGKNILSGWIKIENLGWVSLGSGRPRDGHRYSNLDRGDYGVNNDGSGNLSGWAWGENFGWISFDGVKIDSGGHFSGYARSANIGYILLESRGDVEFAVRTDPYPWARLGGGEEMKTAAAGTGPSSAVGGTAAAAGVPAVTSTIFQYYYPVVVPSEYRPGVEPGRRELTTNLIVFQHFIGNAGSQRGPPEKIKPHFPEYLFITRLFASVGFFCV